MCQVASVVSDSLRPPWTVARQAPLSVGFSRQEYWRGLACPPAGNLPDLEIEPSSLASPALQAGPLPLAPPGKPKGSLGPRTSLNLTNVLSSRVRSRANPDDTRPSLAPAEARKHLS